MPFNPIDEFPTLKLPIRGKTYVIASPSASTGLWVQSIMAAATAVRSGVAPADSDVNTVLDDDEEDNLHRRVLGDTYTELVADGVPWHTLKKVGSTVVMWITYGEDTAERYWNDGGDDPKALAPETKSSENEAPPA